MSKMDKRIHNRLYEENVCGIYTTGSMFIFKNRRSEDCCMLTAEEVLELSEELKEWAKDIKRKTKK